MSHTICQNCKLKPSQMDWEISQLPLFKGSIRLWLCWECREILKKQKGITMGFEQ